MGRYTLTLINKDIRENLTLRKMLVEFKNHGCPDSWIVPFNTNSKESFVLRDSPKQRYIITISTTDNKIQGLIAFSPKYGHKNTVSIDSLCARKCSRGNGTILMNEMFSHNKKDTSYLVTSVESSVGFYKKFGFNVYDTDKTGVYMYKK